MRKALFAVVLVSASFAGGAIVNGPGLRWAQAMVLNRMGMEDEEGESDDLSAVASSSPGSAEGTLPRSIPPLVADSPAPPRPAARPEPLEPERPPARDRDSSALPASILPGLAPVPEATLPVEPIPAPAPAPAPAPSADRPAPRPAPVAAVLEPIENQPAPVPAPDRDKGPDPDRSIRRVSATDAATVTEGPSESSTTGWAEVRNNMRALGVSRYGIEGEPAGRVRFHCVIPLAGRRAVSQQFEAEGDDDLQAARAALKRVALWKATEGASAP